MSEKKHTPGPWEIMPCPKNKGKHPYHDHRWIVTKGARPEFSPYNLEDWAIARGQLVCEMRDGSIANAHLIAAAPELLAELEDANRELYELAGEAVGSGRYRHLDEIIAKAKGETHGL